MSARLPVIRGGLVAVCALTAMALGAQPVHAEPKPETPPPSNGVKSPQPSPTPAAASTKSKSTTTSAPASSSHVSTSSSTSTPTVRRVVVTTPIAHNPVPLPSPSTAPTRRHTAPPKTHTAPPRHDLAQLFELRDLDGLREVPSGVGSRSSGLLLAAGFALILLVIAETSFLGLAGFRFGARGARAPSNRRPAGEPLAIRRVQLRR